MLLAGKMEVNNETVKQKAFFSYSSYRVSCKAKSCVR